MFALLFCFGFGLLTSLSPDTLLVFKEHDRKTESLGTKCHGHPKQNNVIRNEFPKGNVIINSFLVHVHVDVYTLSNINPQHISRYKIFSSLVAFCSNMNSVLIQVKDEYIHLLIS